MHLNDEQLAQALIKDGLIQEKTAKNLIENAKTKNISLEELLVERELIADEKLGAIIADLYKVPFIKLSDKTFTEHLLNIIPYSVASHQLIIPFEKKKEELLVATINPKNYELISTLEKKTGLNIVRHYATKKDIKNALKAYNRDVNSKFKQLLKSALKDPSKIESLKDAAKILDTIILFAYQNNASDIHLEPHKDFLNIRYRIDGILQPIAELPREIMDLLITRIKVLANLRTDEHRAAQDGRIKIDLESNEITLRVSIVPTYDGEKTVLRILSSVNQELDIASLGYSGYNMELINRNISKTHGMILVTGPTGSGKTTTMYSLLKILNSPEINIATIEDPVEYRLEGINQIQVNPKTNLTFATGLRSLLRQDPNVIMVGEIRDEETAGIAINAALTGHLVFATLHTNDVATTLPRLVDMGIEAFLVASTVQIAIAQRLVRTICAQCKTSYELKADELKSLEKKFNIDLKKTLSDLAKSETITLYKGTGCAKCASSGFKGRTTIAEVMENSEEIKKLIFENHSPKDIEDQAKSQGMIPMFIDGLQKVLSGATTIEEVLRVMHS